MCVETILDGKNSFWRRRRQNTHRIVHVNLHHTRCSYDLVSQNLVAPDFVPLGDTGVTSNFFRGVKFTKT